MTSALFSPITLRDLTLDNRIVVSPMCQYAAVDGTATDWHLMNLGQYAMGAAGLVFTEATHVSPEARITPKCLGLWSDENEAALKHVVDFCRQWGVTALGIQIAHAGRKASTNTPLDGRAPLTPEQGAWETLAPSALPFADWHVPRAMDAGDLETVKRQFVETTRRAARIGFDTAELHAAHGYLMHEFLSPLSNRRDDGYGGPLENRMRLLLETFEATRAVWPADKPLGVRVSASDWVPGGWDIEETVVVARELEAMGCDFIDVSSGGNDPSQKIDLKPGYQVHFAERVKREVKHMTVMAVGLITEAQQAEEIVASGKADMVALARAMMDDPRWAWHAAKELGVETAYAPQYIRCAPKVWPGPL